jgi:predicted  nucleic acid-binding Zn-ribbon protein
MLDDFESFDINNFEGFNIEDKYIPPNPAEWAVKSKPEKYSEYCVKCGHVRKHDATLEQQCQKCNRNMGWVRLPTTQTDQDDPKSKSAKFPEYCVKCGHERAIGESVIMFCPRCMTNSGWARIVPKPAQQPRDQDKPKTNPGDTW